MKRHLTNSHRSIKPPRILLASTVTLSEFSPAASLPQRDDPPHYRASVHVHTNALPKPRLSFFIYIYSTTAITQALFSPDDLFVLIEGFWRLAVFNEA